MPGELSAPGYSKFVPVTSTSTKNATVLHMISTAVKMKNAYILVEIELAVTI